MTEEKSKRLTCQKVETCFRFIYFYAWISKLPIQVLSKDWFRLNDIAIKAQARFSRNVTRNTRKYTRPGANRAKSRVTKRRDNTAIARRPYAFHTSLIGFSLKHAKKRRLAGSPLIGKTKDSASFATITNVA